MNKRRIQSHQRYGFHSLSKRSGIVIFDKPLFLRALRNELLSILLCWILGFLIAAATFWTDPMANDWPTDEMVNRGTKTSMLAGLPVAFVSGMGVALSVMNNEVSGLVGKNVHSLYPVKFHVVLPSLLFHHFLPFKCGDFGFTSPTCGQLWHVNFDYACYRRPGLEFRQIFCEVIQRRDFLWQSRPCF